MSAVLQTVEAQFEPFLAQRLDDVLAIEQVAYPHPWTRGNFLDSLHHGYQMQLLTAQPPGQRRSTVLGYFVAMKGVDETHLLNITVAPAYQGQGWARVMLEALATWSRGQGLRWLWLEVRRSNTRAQNLYQRFGFARVGERKGYYPASTDPAMTIVGSAGQREDAVVMSLLL